MFIVRKPTTSQLIAKQSLQLMISSGRQATNVFASIASEPGIKLQIVNAVHCVKLFRKGITTPSLTGLESSC